MLQLAVFYPVARTELSPRMWGSPRRHKTPSVCGMYRVRCVPESAREHVAVVAAETDKYVPQRSLRQVRYRTSASEESSDRARNLPQWLPAKSLGVGCVTAGLTTRWTRTAAKPSESDPRRSGHLAFFFFFCGDLGTWLVQEAGKASHVYYVP